VQRRQFIAMSAGAALAGVAGCSGDGGNETPVNDNATPTAESSPAGEGETGSPAAGTPDQSGSPTSNGTPEPAAGYLIDSLSAYRTVTNNPDEWVGEQISANDVSYYDSYQEEYSGFRALYNDDKLARPFMLKSVQPKDNADNFSDGEEISFDGIVEKIGEVQDTKIILVENVTIR